MNMLIVIVSLIAVGIGSAIFLHIVNKLAEAYLNSLKGDDK